MGYATAGEIIGRAATQCGILSLSQSQAAAFDPWGSVDINVILMVDMLRSVGGEVSERVKAGRIKVATITTAASATSYAVPTDFEEMLDDTAWDGSNTRPLYGPVTPQFSQWFKAWDGGTGAYIPFRLQARNIVFPVAPADGLTLTYEYVSGYWAQSTGAPAADKSYPTVATDTVLFDDEMMVLGLRLYWSEQKGYDTTVLTKRYNDAVDRQVGITGGGATLSLNGPAYGNRMVDERNMPITGWGT